MTTETETQGVFKTKAHRIAFKKMYAKIENAHLRYIVAEKKAEAEFKDTLRRIEEGEHDE